MNAVTPVKDRKQFFERDETNSFFSALTLDHLYEMTGTYCTLHDGVHEEVRSYFNVVVSLYLYGWLYYPLYTLACEISFFAVEMALRKRFPPEKLTEKKRDPRNLGDLFRIAKAAGLLRDEGFPSLQNRREAVEEFDDHMAELCDQDSEQTPPISYVDFLIRSFPSLRNRFAHPSLRQIMMPGPALDGPLLAAEIINQLWPRPSNEQPSEGVKAEV